MPYQLDASRIVVETPSNRLSDVTLAIGLFGGGVRLLFRYTGVEVLIENLLNDDLSVIPPLTDAAYETLSEYGATQVDGRHEILYRAHLELDPGATELLLSTYLNAGPDHQDLLKASGFTFRLTSSAVAGLSSGRISIAQSILLSEGAFVEVESVYVTSSRISEVVERAIIDVRTLLSKMGLNVAGRTPMR